MVGNDRNNVWRINEIWIKYEWNILKLFWAIKLFLLN